MTKLIAIFTIFLSLIANIAQGDNYQFYFPQNAEDSNGDGIPDTSAMNVKIVNTSTYTVYDGNLSGYYGLNASSYSGLVTQLNNGIAGSAYTATLDYTGSTKHLLDFTDSTLTIREDSVIQLSDGNAIGSNFNYDRVTKVDVSNGSVSSQILVANSQAAYDYANNAGFTVMLASTAINRTGNAVSLTTFSSNVTNDSTTTANVQSKGGFVAEQIKGGDGATLFRQATDGTVHIGANSIVLSDESVSSSGNDEVYSSSSVLQLGNNNSHRTVIKGSLEIENPRKSNHAANKRYVDGIGAMSLASMSATSSVPKTGGFGIGTGYIDGQSALAVGIKSNYEPWNATTSASFAYNASTQEFSLSTGIGWGW